MPQRLHKLKPCINVNWSQLKYYFIHRLKIMPQKFDFDNNKVNHLGWSTVWVGVGEQKQYSWMLHTSETRLCCGTVDILWLVLLDFLSRGEKWLPNGKVFCAKEGVFLAGLTILLTFESF